LRPPLAINDGFAEPGVIEDLSSLVFAAEVGGSGLALIAAYV